MDPETDSKFKDIHKIAKDAMADGLAAVSGTPSPDDAAKIDRFFGGHDAATVGKLKTNLGALNTHVINLPAETDCAGECDTGPCAGGHAIAYNNGIPSASHTTICVPQFKELGSDADRARNLIHETAHGTSPLGGAPGTGTKDLGYRHERMLFELSASDRLRNSDSYALFVMFVHEAKTTKNPNAVPPGIQMPERDKLIGFAPGDPETPALKLALAQMEKRLTWSKDHVGQLFGFVVKVRTTSTSWASSADFTKIMTEAAKDFPLTPPPAKPTLDDQTRLAGIEDRYLRMSVTSKHDLTVTRAATGVVSWSPAASTSPFVAGNALSIGPDFFRANPEDQVSLLLEALARNTKDVEPNFLAAYVSLAKWLHKNA
jgi:hypothetical protein